MTTAPAALPTDTSADSGVPTDVAHPRAIRSFVRRAGRTTIGQTRALQELGPRYLIPYRAGLQTLADIYPQLAASGTVAPVPARPLVLEIGFGMGEASAQIAATLPGTDFLCCEVHEPGVGALLKRIGEEDLHNIRILAHDAVEVLDRMLPIWESAQPLRGLDGVHIFFPDPWHKKRHHKRRLIQSALVHRLAQRLKPGGYLHCATDWEPYARQILQVLSDAPLLVNLQRGNHPELGGFASRPAYRPPTKFEQRGLRLGYGVWDIVFHRA